MSVNLDIDDLDLCAEKAGAWKQAIRSLVAEVRRYRAELDHVEVELVATREELAMARDEAHEMRLWAEEAARAENENAKDLAQAYDFARNKGETLEREAVVAWLREVDSKHDYTGLDHLVDCIERGEHRRQEKP